MRTRGEALSLVWKRLFTTTKPFLDFLASDKYQDVALLPNGRHCRKVA